VLVGLYVAYQLALLLLVHVKARFLFPMMPFFCGFAASFLAASFARREKRGRADDTIASTPIRLAAGAALAALLLVLAFAGPALDRLCAG
jgi:hypothetical protein